jgi:uncharacterized tellurite resistance protein B-like protein
MDATDRFGVLAAAALDGSVGPEEREILLKAARELGVIPKMAEQILAETKKGGDLAARIPADPKQRTTLFRSLVDVIAADGQVDKKELALFHRLGPAFGINELEVEDLLRSAAAAKRDSESQRLKKQKKP